MCVCVCVCVVCECVLCPRTANHAMLHKAHCVDQRCISLYMLYSARNVFKTIIGCDCYPLLVLRLPNDFLFHLSPKWLVGTHCTSTGPPTAYWGWTSTWVGGAGNGLDVNMGRYGVVDEWE